MSISEHQTSSVSSVKRGPWLIPFLRRLATAAIGTVGLWYINQGFDYVLYPIMPIVADSWGYRIEESALLTLAVMVPLSIILSLAIIWLHDWIGRDVFGLETLKELKALTVIEFPPIPQTWWRAALYLLFLPVVFIRYGLQWAWVTFSKWKYGDIVAYIGFSFYDPVYGMLYMRKSEHAYKGFTARDWRFFFGSIVIANVVWTIVVVLIAPLLWNTFLGLAHL